VSEGTSAEPARALWSRGRAAWPSFELPFEVFAEHLSSRLGDALDPEIAMRLCAEDLYLALACARGVTWAVTMFEDRFSATIDRAVGRVATSPAAAEELRQVVLVRLLVPERLGEEPRIAQYSGRGSLAAWVSIAAGRSTLNARRALESPTGTVEELLADRALADEEVPELALIRKRYQSAFVAALRQALAELDRDHRSLLRLHYVDRLTMDALASLFRVSRAGAHRRLATAREDMFQRTCGLLRKQLQIDTAELSSLLRLVRSDLDISLHGLLR
jgi:RNA polymerase sigma-70 factor, ECF subfamily